MSRLTKRVEFETFLGLQLHLQSKKCQSFNFISTHTHKDTQEPASNLGVMTHCKSMA